MENNINTQNAELKVLLYNTESAAEELQQLVNDGYRLVESITSNMYVDDLNKESGSMETLTLILGRVVVNNG